MKDIVFYDGIFMEFSEAMTSVEDRGNTFGDGVYDVVCCFNRAMFAACRGGRSMLVSGVRKESLHYGHLSGGDRWSAHVKLPPASHMLFLVLVATDSFRLVITHPFPPPATDFRNCA